MPAAARRSLAPLAVLAMLAGPAHATTFVGVSERTLARAADAIVIGTVAQIETVAGADGTISTLVTLDVGDRRSEEHTSELQSLRHLVCRLLLEKKKRTKRLSILLAGSNVSRSQHKDGLIREYTQI